MHSYYQKEIINRWFFYLFVYDIMILERVMFMNNLYFPICAVLINLLIVIVFNSKQRINTDETKIYSYLVYIGIIESTLACILVILMNIYGIPQYIYTLHRIDYILMISWIWGLFYYVTSLTFEKDITKKRIKKITITFNVIVSILFFFLKVNVINSEGKKL